MTRFLFLTPNNPITPTHIQTDNSIFRTDNKTNTKILMNTKRNLDHVRSLYKMVSDYISRIFISCNCLGGLCLIELVQVS